MSKGNRTNHNGKYYAHSFKDNFWSKKRVEANITLNEVADLLKCKQSTAGAYFTGFLIPSEEDIKTLCDFFGVDVIEGTREFIDAHKRYDTEQKLTLKYSGKPKAETKVTSINNTDIFEPIACEKDAQENTEEHCEEVAQEPAKDYTPIIKMLYSSNASFETYNEFIEGLMMYSPAVALKATYGKVDIDTYNSIFKELERGEI